MYVEFYFWCVTTLNVKHRDRDISLIEGSPRNIYEQRGEWSLMMKVPQLASEGLADPTPHLAIGFLTSQEREWHRPMDTR